MQVNGVHYTSVWADGDSVVIINQQKLPFDFELLKLTEVGEVIEAIASLKVRGAPAIGIAAAYAMWLSAIKNGEVTLHDFTRLVECRPTAVNLRRGAEFVFNQAFQKGLSTNQVLLLAQKFAENEMEACRVIGFNGAALIEELFAKKSEQIHVLTHCNAGWLACGDYGTALAPIFEAHRRGVPIHVWVDETRPLNQGARLTAWELANEHISFDIISDNSGALLMMQNKVDCIVVGADRIVKNGDVANKIGTYQKALAAHEHHVPFWVAAPLTTFDFTIEKGMDIPIEQRNGEELQKIKGCYNNKERIEIELFPSSYPAMNHAFDITPAKFVDAYITEQGILKNTSELL